MAGRETIKKLITVRLYMIFYTLALDTSSARKIRNKTTKIDILSKNQNLSNFRLTFWQKSQFFRAGTRHFVSLERAT